MRLFVLALTVVLSATAMADEFRFQYGNRNRRPERRPVPVQPAPVPVQPMPLHLPTVIVDGRGEGSGLYPDQNTANALCVRKGYQLGAASFSTWKQAGGAILGLYSPDGSNFASHKWFTGQAILSANCYVQPQPVTISIGGGYHPDATTALALCRRAGKQQMVSFTPFRQAGGTIEGIYSPDGVNFIGGYKWHNGQAIFSVVCQ